jgi:CubicO group peptidase (beta-lactamase class C family)
MHQEFRALVDKQELAGIVTLLARKGVITDFDAYGYQDATAGAPVQKDTIFRLASMTKPVIGLAMMQLYEQGRWKLDDPVAKHIPEFAHLKVRTPDGPVDQKRPMLMWQLMSHTAGFPWVTDIAPLVTSDLQGMIEVMATQQIAVQPGTLWIYSWSVDIQGRIVEKLSGVDLADYMQRHIFDPLKMVDTQFWVDPSKVGRVTKIHAKDAASGKMVSTENQLFRGPGGGVPTSKPRFLSGGGGLFSTASDYHRFCQALLNGGELDGARVLRPETVELMRTDVMGPHGITDGMGLLGKGVGFGMDFAVHTDPAQSGLPFGLGTYWWGGACGTWFWIDPANDLIFIGMIQNAFDLQNVDRDNPTPLSERMRAFSAPFIYGAVSSGEATLQGAAS